METVDYATALTWYAMWPVVIVVAYQFIRMNIEHLEENIETKEKKQ